MNIDIEKLVTVLGSALAVISLANDKIRNYILNKVIFKKKSTVAIDETIDRLILRVNTLSTEFVTLNERNLETQKENYELKMSMLKFKKDVIANCKNKCFGETS